MEEKHRFAKRVGWLVLLIGFLALIASHVFLAQWFTGLSGRGVVGVILLGGSSVFLGIATAIVSMLWFYRVAPHDPFRHNMAPIEISTVLAACCLSSGLVAWALSGDRLPNSLEGLVLFLLGTFLLGLGTVVADIGHKLEKDASK
jgi:hypothetical protein